jgi:hypothetical protein
MLPHIGERGESALAVDFPAKYANVTSAKSTKQPEGAMIPVRVIVFPVIGSGRSIGRVRETQLYVFDSASINDVLVAVQKRFSVPSWGRVFQKDVWVPGDKLSEARAAPNATITVIEDLSTTGEYIHIRDDEAKPKH